ncbi:hypothetical protein SISNIDRAFT_50907 [Sistotremastrum niveocremeum HHB9708]|uniref:Uncharacterized protein n=1 Tax=Sistotremastrum niveocremeum HHB9708 TaxID=1314777 RepID=A0A164VZT3_9AGAM|nr:hypothetical protein SISNIDRAFT_50907 [Sistotremastrum niveocremeum HHB9708]
MDRKFTLKRPYALLINQTTRPGGVTGHVTTFHSRRPCALPLFRLPLGPQAPQRFMERLQRDHGTDVSRYPRHQPPFSRASSNLGDDVGSSGFTIKKPKNKTRPRRVESDEDDEERERRDLKELRDYEAQSKRSKNRYPPQKPTQLARPRAPEPIKVDESSGDEMALKPDIPDKSYNRVDVNIDFDELPEPVPKSSSSESSSSKSSMLARPKPPRLTLRTKEGQGSTQETVRKRLSSSVSEFIPLGNSKAAARDFDKLPSPSIKTSAGKFKTPEARSCTTKSTAPRSPPVDLTETTPVKCPTKVDKQPVAGSSKKNKAVPKSPPFLSTAKPKSKMKKAPQAQQFPMEIPSKPDSTPSVPRTAQPFPVSQNSQNDENSPPPRTSPKRKRGEPYGSSNKHAKKPSNPVELLAMEKSSKASASKPDRVAEAWKLSPRRPNLPDLSDSDRDVSIEPEFSFTQIVGARRE